MIAPAALSDPGSWFYQSPVAFAGSWGDTSFGRASGAASD